MSDRSVGWNIREPLGVAGPGFVHVSQPAISIQCETGTGRHFYLQWRAAYLRQQSRLRLKCDGTSAETRFCLSAKQTSPFKSAGASVQSTTGSQGVCITSSNAGYTMLWGSVKGTGYPFHLSVSPSLPFPWITMCHHVSTGLYLQLKGSSLNPCPTTRENLVTIVQ